LPIFLVVLFGIVDFGLGLRAWIMVTNSARESARYAAVTCATSTGNETAVKDRAVATAPDLVIVADVTVTNCPGDSTESVIVKVDYDYELLTPLSGFMRVISGGAIASTIPLSSTANMRLE
jgi:Flp pilus assembly protein TadG